MSRIQNLINICFLYLQQELYWTHHWQKNITIPEIKSNDKDRWANQDKFPEDELSDTSSRDYPELYLESEYGQRTDREADFETEQVRHFHNIMDHLSSDHLVSSLVRARQLSQGPLNIWTEHSNCQIHSRGDSKTVIALLIPNIFLISFYKSIFLCI